MTRAGREWQNPIPRALGHTSVVQMGMHEAPRGNVGPITRCGSIPSGRNSQCAFANAYAEAQSSSAGPQVAGLCTDRPTE